MSHQLGSGKWLGCFTNRNNSCSLSLNCGNKGPWKTSIRSTFMFVITKDWFRTTQRQQQAFQSGVTQTKGNRGPEHKHRRISPITWLTLREQVSWLRASSPLSPFLPPPPSLHPRATPCQTPWTHGHSREVGALTQGLGAKSCHLNSGCGLPISHLPLSGPCASYDAIQGLCLPPPFCSL